MNNDKQTTAETKSPPPLTPEADAKLTQSVVQAEQSNAKQLKKQRRVRILIPSGRDPHEQCPVTVGVNGFTYLIVRDKEVSVPESVLHTLNLAVEKTPVLDQELRIADFRAVPRFPVQVLGFEN